MQDKVTSVWVFFYKNDRGEETIPTVRLENGMEIEAIALDPRRAQALRDHVQRQYFEREIRMVRFDARVELGVVPTLSTDARLS